MSSTKRENWNFFGRNLGFGRFFKAEGLDLKIGNGEWGENIYMQRYKNHPLPIHHHAGSLLKLLFLLGTNGRVWGIGTPRSQQQPYNEKRA